MINFTENGIKMIQIEEGQLLLKTTDFKLVRTKEDVITIRLYEVMAGEESAKFIAGPAVPSALMGKVNRD